MGKKKKMLDISIDKSLESAEREKLQHMTM